MRRRPALGGWSPQRRPKTLGLTLGRGSDIIPSLIETVLDVAQQAGKSLVAINRIKEQAFGSRQVKPDCFQAHQEAVP